MPFTPKIAFLSYQEMNGMLVSELKDRFNLDLSKSKVYGDLILLEDDSAFAGGKYPYWARTCLLNPVICSYESIGQAAKMLKEIQRNWASYQFCQFRRASLIQEKLPYINLKLKEFPFKIPQSPIGLYTLLDEKTILYSDKTSSFVAAGDLQLIEDHENPPSRAYLKLEEALIRFTSHYGLDFPDQNSRCFDAGACPGGWTWVLRQLGSSVFAVDRAELAPELMSDPEVEFQKHDAFTFKPEEIGPFDYVFSDVICYPERLFEWVNIWIESAMTKNMICTIKMQGDINWPLVEKFASIPGSHVVHLNHNKHELTWMWHKED
ncbi:MAG: SAM-dependent methyltransferase [Treponemataceae bacterium]|nr:SAM-dependent methyltransferase [Treponemataceae bacterium]